MADKPAFVSTANHFAQRAAQSCDPDDRARLLAAAGFYYSFAEAANKTTVSDPRYWRERACEMRTDAELLTDEQERQTILCIANDYDRLAERAERQALTPSPCTKRFDLTLAEAKGEPVLRTRHFLH